MTARHKRRLVLVTLALVALLLAHAPLLRGMARFMAVHDPPGPKPAQLILPVAAPEVAAELYRAGRAERIALWTDRPNRLEALGVVPTRHAMRRETLLAAGVPPEGLVEIGAGLTDLESLGHAAERHILRASDGRGAAVLVVVAAPWSRLTKRALERGASDRVEFRMYPVAPDHFDMRSWWTSEAGLVTFFDAYWIWLRHLLTR